MLIDVILFCLYPFDKSYISMIGLPSQYILFYYFRALVTIAILVIIAKYFESALRRNSKWMRIVEYIGTNTLIILCVHDPVKRAVIFVCSKLTGISITLIREDLTYSIICSIIVLSLMFPVIWLYKRYVEKYVVTQVNHK